MLQRLPCRFALLAVWAVLVVAGTLWADTVRLTNGDLLSGEVVSLDATQLKIKSQVLGEIAIARTKVQSITLGELPAQPAAIAPASAAQPAGGGGQIGVEDILKQLGVGGAPAGTNADLFKQLQGGGVSAAEMDKLKKQFPLIAAPEVQSYVTKTLGGLMSGSLSINDIRNEAIRARDETKAAIKDLGPEAEQALQGYLGILDRFIKETEPKTASPPAPPAPQPTAPPAKLP